MYNVKECDRAEFIQIYRMEVYIALTKWKLTSNFETYLYQYVRGVYRNFMNSIKMFKKDLTYSLFTDLSELEFERATYTEQEEEQLRGEKDE